MKKILLIGSTGYLGKKLKLKLSKNNILVCPSRKKGFDIRKKSELKKYYLKVRDAYVLLDRIDEEYEKLLQEKKDYYSVASIKDCLEIQKLKLDQVSKNINLSGSFADLHLSLCTDNAAMIGWNAIEILQTRKIRLTNYNIRPTPNILIHENF